MPERNNTRSPRAFFGTLMCLALLLSPQPARSEVTRSGDWPGEEPRVSLDLSGVPRAAALRELAEQAGWSLVFRDTGDERVHLLVNDQPASKVLALLLDDASYTAARDGALISIRRSAAADQAAVPTTSEPTGPKPPKSASPLTAPTAPKPPKPASPMAPPKIPEPPKPPKPPVPAKERSEARGRDRLITGNNVTIGADEVVHDLSVIGGSVELLGRVTGDLSVMGGSMNVGPSALIEGDVSVIGGSLALQQGARLEGDVHVMGGSVQRADGVEIQGEIVIDDDDNDITKGEKMTLSMQHAGDAMTGTALLFLFGTILMALAGRRMETLQLELASKPMRSFALGIVASIATLLVFVLLCITVVGIPLALAGLLAAVFAGYSGICAVLTTVGSTLVQHRSDNVYVHLAVGCGLWLLLGSIPFIGGWISFAVVSAGLGAVFATRGAGLLPSKWNKPQGPYRTATT